jgi:hypothetical protein
MNPSRSIATRFYVLIVCIVSIVTGCSSTAFADSLHLRNGRYLQGKYVGGSTTMIGFMTAGSVEYFQTSDVLALMFDSNAEPSPNGLQPNHMNGDSSQPTFPGTPQRTSVRSRTDRKAQSRPQPREVNPVRD